MTHFSSLVHQNYVFICLFRVYKVIKLATLRSTKLLMKGDRIKKIPRLKTFQRYGSLI